MERPVGMRVLRTNFSSAKSKVCIMILFKNIFFSCSLLVSLARKWLCFSSTRSGCLWATTEFLGAPGTKGLMFPESGPSVTRELVFIHLHPTRGTKPTHGSANGCTGAWRLNNRRNLRKYVRSPGEKKKIDQSNNSFLLFIFIGLYQCQSTMLRNEAVSWPAAIQSDVGLQRKQLWPWRRSVLSMIPGLSNAVRASAAGTGSDVRMAEGREVSRWRGLGGWPRGRGEGPDRRKWAGTACSSASPIREPRSRVSVRGRSAPSPATLRGLRGRLGDTGPGGRALPPPGRGRGSCGQEGSGARPAWRGVRQARPVRSASWARRPAARVDVRPLESVSTVAMVPAVAVEASAVDLEGSRGACALRVPPIFWPDLSPMLLLLGESLL